VTPRQGQTQAQRRYRAALGANLENNTGRSLAQWLVLARTCPAGGPRARLRWMKERHGLGQNYAMLVLDALDGAKGVRTDSPAALRRALWKDAHARATLVALEHAVARIPGVVAGQRKGYTLWSRAFSFAAARPVRGAVRLGLALEPGATGGLVAPHHEGWPERLTATLVLAHGEPLPNSLSRLLAQAAASAGQKRPA
jgi:hypothetical protein